MRVALIYEMLGGAGGGGGIARAVLELATGLNELGHEALLVCHDFRRSDEFEQLAGPVEVRALRPDITELPRGQVALGRRRLAGMRSLSKLVPDDVDVVNAHGVPALHAGSLAARRLDAPLVWSRWDDTLWERGVIPRMTARGDASTLKRLARTAFGLVDLADGRRAGEIVVASKFDASMVHRAYRRSARVIRIGPSAAFFNESNERLRARRALGVPDDDYVVLGFGLLVPHRRFEDLIDAAAVLRDEPGLSVLIVGSDAYAPEYGRRLAQLIQARGLSDHVTLDRRSIDDRELRALYAAADVYVFAPSRQSYGIAPLEALACRTRVVVSRGAGVHEVLEGRGGVAVVPPGRPDELARAVHESRGNDDREGLEQTREWIRSKLSNAAYASAMENVFVAASRA